MTPLCSFVPLRPCQGSGFLVCLLTVPFDRFPSILHFSPPPNHSNTPPSLLSSFPMSSPATNAPLASSTTPRVPTVPLSSVFPQTILENGYDHLRDRVLNTGYMYYGSQVSDFEPTYSQVRGWDRNGVCFELMLCLSRMDSPCSLTLVWLKGSLTMSGVISMTKAIFKVLISNWFPPSMVTRTGRLNPFSFRPTNCQSSFITSSMITPP